MTGFTDAAAQPSPLRHNIELKARCANLESALHAAQTLGCRHDRSMRQVDTYFRSPRGRLKLREITEPAGITSAELIWYDRPDAAEYRGSNYYVVPAPDPALLESALTAACGVRGVVAKHRDVYLFHNVRVHLDRVEHLGSFVEFEAVMTEGEDEPTSRRRLDVLHVALGLRAEDHEPASYSDLLGI